MCLQCLDAIADAFDRMEKVALSFQIEASWRGCSTIDDDNGPYAGYQCELPTIALNAWLEWFHRASPQRQLIRDLVAASLRPSAEY